MPWPGAGSPLPVTLDRVQGPRGELVLQKRGAEYEMVYNGVLLMASYNGASEAEMARIAHRRWKARPGSGPGRGSAAGRGGSRNGGAAGPGLSVLVGGLGMGYTLAAVLDLPDVERVDVVELEPAVVAWNRGPLRHLNGRRLDDPRVRLVVADLADPVALPADACGYHLILVDIDNGPERTVLSSNRELYRPRGLLRLARRLAGGAAAGRGAAAAAAEPGVYGPLGPAGWGDRDTLSPRAGKDIDDGERTLSAGMSGLRLRPHGRRGALKGATSCSPS